ncbi:hypothetical protein ACFQAS_05130 [Halopenitus salinus]|jgi:ribosomal protein L37E|uniref:Small CPxCG-related zinc finger protein n=1 Tax=Halopenitus salinus TaxID=1198295 RepID=A0ABD5URC2_9EURY
MSDDDRCLRCGNDFEYDRGSCPNCGWDSEAFRERGRYGLARPGTGEWDDD